MTAVVANLYDQFRLSVFKGGGIDFTLSTDTIKCAIVTAAYSLNQNLDDFFTDVSAAEVSGTGYTQGGNQCASITPTVDGSGLVTVDLSNPVIWSQDAGGFSDGRRAIVYKSTGVESASRLIAYSDDFGSNQGNVSADFSIEFDSTGLIRAAR